VRLPKGAIKPRPAVQQMAPYSPPTGGRAGKLRLDFNENTVGCSPRVIDAIRACVTADGLAVYPEYSDAKQAIAAYFHVKPEQFVFTNGTDEAIQVFINTYVDDGQEVLVLKPAYAMYRFYAEVAGAKIKEVAYPPPGMEFPLQEVLDAITPETRAVLLSNPNNPTGTGISLLGIERILHRARKAAVLVDEAYYEFCGVTALTEIERVPNLFVCRTFSKVFGMAAMRLGCLFSHEANIAYLHKAQSPYSVNGHGGAGRESRGGRYRLRADLCRRSAGGARTALRGPGKARDPLRSQLGEFRAGATRQARHRSPRRPPRAGHPGARPQLRSARLRALHRGHARADAPPAGRAGRNLEHHKR
jgi:hypothetical protein